jgi:hypothetical protein
MILKESQIHKITRISYNKGDWQRPTGDARLQESSGTYNHEFGFGHEDWLFRSQWSIDGWRYAFIQGVNKSHSKLVKANRPFQLTLFTVHPDRRRRYVATIHNVECLDEQQADEALTEFKARGWYDIMLQEIKAVGGDEKALGKPQFAKYVLNVRFRQENLELFTNAFATAADPIHHMNRYQLRNPEKALIGGRSGKSDAPNTKKFLRRASLAIECTPEHARMQKTLMSELKAEYPNAKVEREKDFVDLTVQTANELIFYEIKSDLEPRAVIRQALGQILEYAYHPSRQHTLPVSLVIVGRCPLSTPEGDYLARLQHEFRLPITYRVVSLQQSTE